MTDDDPLDALLRRHGPPAVDDDGFTARTLRALPPADRVDAARALVLEQRRYAAQLRRWRWATAGVVAGTLATAAVVTASSGAVDVGPPAAPQAWLPLSLVLCAGALWYAWKAFRAG